MSRQLRTTVSRTGGEFILIVVGVLAALAVDTWVDQVQLSRDAEEYRAGLLEDLSRDSELLELRAAQRRRAFEYVRFSLSYFEGSSPTSDPAEVLLAVHESTTSRPFEPTIATWSDLLSTGSTDLIEDRELRSEIGAYYASIESYARNWDPFPPHREAVRGLIPFDMYEYFSATCNILRGGLDPKPQPCDLSPIDRDVASRVLDDLADDQSFVRALRYFLTQLEVSIRQLEGSVARVDDLVLRLDET